MVAQLKGNSLIKGLTNFVRFLFLCFTGATKAFRVDISRVFLKFVQLLLYRRYITKIPKYCAVLMGNTWSEITRVIWIPEEDLCNLLGDCATNNKTWLTSLHLQHDRRGTCKEEFKTRKMDGQSRGQQYVVLLFKTLPLDPPTYQHLISHYNINTKRINC